MPSRKTFLKAMGIMSGTFMVPEAFAHIKKGEAQLVPMLTNRNIKNSYWYIGHLMSLLITSKETARTYALLRATERRGLEPPPHIHTKEDEAFLILDGKVVYTVGNQTFEAKKGDVMFLPRNIQHSFKIQSEKLETLILLTPGGLENYFVEMSTAAEKLQLPPMPAGPPDIKKLVATASKYGVKFPTL